MEGLNYWAREINKLEVSHTTRLISIRPVKPFVINNKTDAADARAICEVVDRLSTNFGSITEIVPKIETSFCSLIFDALEVNYHILRFV